MSIPGESGILKERPKVETFGEAVKLPRRQ